MGGLEPYIPLLLDGLKTTVFVAVLSIAGATVISVALGVLRSGRSRRVRWPSGAVVEVARSASVIIWLFWLYYALPLVPGAPQPGSTTLSVLVIACVLGVYGAESVRAGIEALPRGQWDACDAIGLSGRDRLRHVILPQALSQVVPAVGSLAIDAIKATAIVSFVGVQDLFYAADTVRAALPTETPLVYGLLIAIYGALCLIASGLFRLLERALPLNRALRPRKRKLVHA
jgi:His/Glu/Gln/Arg/opine family amino acid ABC transporter permease subunit